MLLLRKRIKKPILQVVLFNFANGNGVEYLSHLLFLSVPMSEGLEYIKIRGANAHNLKNVDVDIPRDRFTVITGLSGSGKS